ncbi:MAG: Y-family DNA polymerase [Bacteroidia bacterium]|nr:Y-family DNA polymerase [Bacteroidia bacterium]
MYALVDCNNFYVSCERVFRPDLNGKAVVVLSNNDGCAIARSNEAKKLGIPMGANAFEYEALFKKHHVHVFSANFALYGDMSQRVMTLLSELSQEIEVYSIDEAFLKISGLPPSNLAKHFSELQKRVYKCTGIPISIGIAPTKALAKISNKIAKKFPKETNNIYIIDDEIKRVKALKWTKIGDVWGIGNANERLLQTLGVKNAFDFTQLNDQFVKNHLTIVGLRLKQDLQGIPTLKLEDVKDKKNIATTRSFEGNITELSALEERISTFAVSCAEKLRKQNNCCTTMMVFIHTNGFRNDLPQYSKNILIKLPFASNSAIELSRFALEGLRKIFKTGFHYKKAGVIVLDLIPSEQVQFKFFDNANPRHIPLMKALDKINANFGQQKLRLASQSTGKIWRMKQEHLSPNYTTKLSDIILINV